MTDKKDEQEQAQRSAVSSETVMASQSQLQARCDSQNSSVNKPSTSHSKMRQGDPTTQLYVDKGKTAPGRQSMNKNKARRDTEEDDLVVAPLGYDNANILQNKQLQHVSTGKRRQLSNFSIKQRLSQGQVVQQVAATTQKMSSEKRQVLQSPQQRGFSSQAPKMDQLVHQQNKQHQAYISRTSNNNQQVLSQSIGEGSNKSYVFDGISQLPPNMTSGGGEPQAYAVRANIRAEGPPTAGQSNNIQIENRSLSNESSPNSAIQRRNLIYRNVRNYNNLYDNRSLASKNIEMQDHLRLGGAQKIWMFKRTDPFLPQIQNQSSMQQSHLSAYTTQKIRMTSVESQQSTQTTQMKRIKHSVMDDGNPVLELRQSPLSSKLEKPATHHGYQSTHHKRGMASTEPFDNLHNMTSNSFNMRDERDYMSKANTANAPFLPELSVSSNFCLMTQTNMLKPILRKNCLHNRNNIIVQWKSFEISTVKLTYVGGADTNSSNIVSRKLLNPVYVPLHELTNLLQLHPSQIEKRVVKSLKLAPSEKQFLYIPQDVSSQQNVETASETFSRKPSLNSTMNNNQGKQATSPSSSNFTATSLFDHVTPERSHSVKQPVSATEQQPSLLEQSLAHNQDSLSNLGTLEDQLPEEIVTSLYIQQAASDFTIVIRPPSIEYSIPSKNFLFIKTLTREENNDFISNKFVDWQNMAIRCLTKYNKFNELLSIMDKGVDYKVHLARQEAQKYQMPQEPGVIPNQSRSPRRNISKLADQQSRKDKLWSPSSMQVFLLQESTGQVSHYSSLNEYRNERLIEPKNGALRGCFSQNGQLGQISVRPFSVVIKGLDTDYEYRHNFVKSQWSKLVGFMQLKSMKRPDDPKQLLDKICKHFERAIHRAESRGTSNIQFRATSVLKSKKQLASAVGNAYPMMTKEEKINEKAQELAQSQIREPSKTTKKLTDLHHGGIGSGTGQGQAEPQTDKQDIPQQQSKDSIEQQQKRFIQDSKQAARSFLSLQKVANILQVSKQKTLSPRDQPEIQRYLVDIELPVCKVVYQGQTHTKQLTEEDLIHLSATQFCRWKNFLMTKHFRLELNIGQEKPLPRIMEDKRGEDDLISETDPRDKYPITEAEKPKIEQTRAQVTNWFPV